MIYTLDTIGQEVKITSEPFKGVLSVDGFTDTVLGVTGTRTLTKSFRYSLDGIYWSEWILLTNLNLNTIPVNPKHVLSIEYLYVRSGSDASGVITISNLSLTLQLEEEPSTDVFSQSIFGKLFSRNSSTVYSWSLNLLRKLYSKGYVPDYIFRSGEVSREDDEDFLDFWTSIVSYFGYIYTYALQFFNILDNTVILSEFLKQRGVYLRNDHSISQLRFLSRVYHSEFAKRGGKLPFIPNSTTTGIDGEFLRLIQRLPLEEYQFQLTESDKKGWTLNSSSPLYKGLEGQIQLNKAYEDSEEFLDLDKYPILLPDEVSVTADTDGKSSLVLPLNSSGSVGIGSGETAPSADKLILVNPYLNYEISFDVRMETPLNILSFGVRAFTQTLELVSLQSCITFTPENFFFTEKPIYGSKYVRVRGILFNVNEPERNTLTGVTNMGYGINLTMTHGVKYIVPMITVPQDSGSEVYVRNLKMNILSTPYSKGWVTPRNFLEFWLRNNNNSLILSRLENILRREFLPYNLAYKVNYLNFLGPDPNNEGLLSTGFWRDEEVWEDSDIFIL